MALAALPGIFKVVFFFFFFLILQKLEICTLSAKVQNSNTIVSFCFSPLSFNVLKRHTNDPHNASQDFHSVLQKSPKT